MAMGAIEFIPWRIIFKAIPKVTLLAKHTSYVRIDRSRGNDDFTVILVIILFLIGSSIKMIFRYRVETSSEARRRTSLTGPGALRLNLPLGGRKDASRG